MLMSCASDTNESMTGEVNSSSEQVESMEKQVDLYGFSVESGILSIRVVSNGCTSEKDFALTFKSEAKTTKVMVTRKKPDLCKAMPRLITVKLQHPKLVCKSQCSFEPVNPLKKPEEFRGARG